MKILLALLLSAFVNSALAIDFEKLFLPGEVIEGHKKLEQDCSECHTRLSDTTQKQLCLNCHEKVAQDIIEKKGFHYKNKESNEADCKICHADHKGREANIVWLDKDQFDHQLTDYELTGKHQQTECVACHKKKDKYRDTPHKCIDCHKEDDAHDNELGEECGNCHNPKAWTGSEFDHDKTDFKLNYEHEKVACDLCHINNDYKKTPSKCVECHSIRDVHENRFGQKCQDCHNEKKWDESLFDHDKDTDFRLKNKHRAVSCHTCHLPPKGIIKKKTEGKKDVRNCYSCHRLDDIHKEKNGKKCEQCHNSKSWLKTDFDHDAETEFALKGAHKKTSCQACHQNDVKGEKTSQVCFDCHKSKDVHREQLGKNCGDCHSETDWISDVRFDHELTSFPLIGQHAVVGCEACHSTAAYQDVDNECSKCHQDDDIHKETLGQNCQTCHNPNDWLIWTFDHDETDFKLKGTHAEVHCHRCHVEPLNENRSEERRCIDCHLQDDIHNGNFGRECDECHSQEEFNTYKLDRVKNIGR